MIFHLVTTFWLTNASTLCDDTLQVTDRAECRAAFPLIRAEDPEALNLISDEYVASQAPKGCILSTLDHLAHWNSHLNGGRGTNFRQICASHGK